MSNLNYINLKSLSMEELAGVVNLYPWYGSARKELCHRMSKMGRDTWDKEQYAEAALYLPERSVIAGIFRSGYTEDLSDKELDTILKAFIKEESAEEEASRPVHVVGGDYFTQAQYDDVKRKEDNVFSRFAAKPTPESEREKGAAASMDDIFCTEPMAQIFAEQGYLEQARHIYSKLLLKFPEKSAYFAALIEKLN